MLARFKRSQRNALIGPAICSIYSNNNAAGTNLKKYSGREIVILFGKGAGLLVIVIGFGTFLIAELILGPLYQQGWTKILVLARAPSNKPTYLTKIGSMVPRIPFCEASSKRTV